MSQNNDSCVQISEDAILNALDAAEVSSRDIDFTHPITIEIADPVESGAAVRFVCINGENQILSDISPTSTTALVKSSELPVACAWGEPARARKLLHSNAELAALAGALAGAAQACTQALNDENDKRDMYKVDDCRRTHNYDEFICTFLSMLTERGVLAELVAAQLERGRNARARRRRPRPRPRARPRPRPRPRK